MNPLPVVPPEILCPRPGEIYCQLGVDIEIIDVAQEYVIYRCSHGYLNGPPLRIGREAFTKNLADGFLEKIR